MQSELSDFVYLVAALEKAAGSLVPQVMEAQILNSQQVAGARKRGPNALGIVGKNVFARLGLCGDKRPGFGRVLEPAMIAVFAGRVLCVADHTGLRGFVVVAPFQPADFRFPPRRGDSEVHDGSHGDRCAPVAALEMFAQPGEFVSGRPSRSLAGLADQAEFAAGGARLLDDLGTHRKLPDALGGPQNDTDPDQVIDDGGWTGAACTARLHMPNKVSGCQIERIGFAERVALQVFQMGLLTTLPARDRLEGVDVPADQLGQSKFALLDAHQGCRFFERHFTVLGPAQRRRAMRKGTTFLMQNRCAAPYANHRRVARGTVRLSACFDRWHDDFLRRQAILVPFMSPQQPINYPESAGIPQKHRKWKTLQK